MRIAQTLGRASDDPPNPAGVRRFRSETRWTLEVCPPRERPSGAALENTGVPPLPETVVHSRPRTEPLRHPTPLRTRPKLPDHALELLPQPLGIRTEPTDRQVRLNELPLHIRQLLSRHNKTIYRTRVASTTNPTD